MDTNTIKPPEGFVLDEIQDPPEGFVLDDTSTEIPDPDISERIAGSGMGVSMEDLPEQFEPFRDKIENSIYYSSQYGIPPELAYDLGPEIEGKTGLKRQAFPVDDTHEKINKQMIDAFKTTLGSFLSISPSPVGIPASIIAVNTKASDVILGFAKAVVDIESEKQELAERKEIMRYPYVAAGMGGFSPFITRKTAPNIPLHPITALKEAGKGIARFAESGVGGAVGGTAYDWLGQFVEQGGYAIDQLSKLGSKNKNEIYNPLAEAVISTGQNISKWGKQSRLAWAEQAAYGWEALDPALAKIDPVSYGAGRISEGLASSALSVLAMYLSGGATAGAEILNKGFQLNRGLLLLSGLSAAGGFQHAQEQEENFFWSTLHGIADGGIEYFMESHFLEGIGESTKAVSAGFKEGAEEFFTGMLQNTRAGILENTKKGMSSYEAAKKAILGSLKQSPWEVAGGFLGGWGMQGGLNLIQITEKWKETVPYEAEEEEGIVHVKSPAEYARRVKALIIPWSEMRQRMAAEAEALEKGPEKDEFQRQIDELDEQAARHLASIAQEGQTQAGKGKETAPTEIVAPGEAEELATEGTEKQGGTVYHGTSQSIEQIKNPLEDTWNGLNIYGQGFYTTDTESVAEGYTKKGKGTTPTVYKVKVSPDAEQHLYDMEKPLDAKIKTDLMPLLKEWELDYILTDPDYKEDTKNLRELYDTMRAEFTNNNVSADEGTYLFNEITKMLQGQGYVGYKHKGGLQIKGKPHIVRIFWSPQTDLEVTPVVEYPDLAPAEGEELATEGTEKNIYYRGDTGAGVLKEAKRTKGLIALTKNKHVAATYVAGGIPQTEEEFNEYEESGQLERDLEKVDVYNVEAKNTLVIDKAGLKVMSGLKDKGNPMAKRIIETKDLLYWWQNTQEEKQEAWEKIIIPQLQKLGYDSIEYQDDVNAGRTLAVFSTKQLSPVKALEKQAEIVNRKSEIDSLREKMEEREAGETDEQLSGITKKRRKSLIKETAERIKAHDIYQNEVAAQDVSGRKIGPGFYYVEESGRGEVEAIIGEMKPGKFKTKLQKMFTFDRADATSGRATAWDVAVQQGLYTETEQGEYDTHGDMELSEFVQRVADAFESGAEASGLNTAALNNFAASGYPDAEMLAEKFRMLRHGSSDIEINEMITEWAERNDVPIESVMDEFVNADKMQKIAELSEDEQDAELERLATEQILAENQLAAQNAAKDVLEANGIEAQVEKVEEIEYEDDVPFQRRQGKATGAAMTKGQRQVIQLALGADIETGAHEGWHLLRSRLTDDDLATLMDKYGPGLRGEELEAAAFGRFYKENKAPTNAIRKIFEKIRKILAKIKSSLQGKGFRTVEDIFGESVTGKVAKRQTDLLGRPVLQGGAAGKQVKVTRKAKTLGLTNADISSLIAVKGLTHKVAAKLEASGYLTKGQISYLGGTIDRDMNDPTFTYQEKLNSIYVSLKEFIRDDIEIIAPTEEKDILAAPQASAQTERKKLGDKPATLIQGNNVDVFLETASKGEVANAVQRLTLFYQEMCRKNPDIFEKLPPLQTLYDEAPAGTKLYSPEHLRMLVGGLQNVIKMFTPEEQVKLITGGAAEAIEKQSKIENLKFETSGQRLRREAELRAQIEGRKARLKAQQALIPSKTRKKGPAIRRFKINIREVTPALRPDLLPEHLDKVIGSAIPGAEELPKSTRTLVRPVYDKEWFDRNMAVKGRDVRDKASSQAKRAWIALEKKFTPMSTRLFNIAPKLFQATRKYVYDQMTRTVWLSDEVSPFVHDIKKMDKTDRRQMDLALKNGINWKIAELTEKYGIQADYEKARAALDEIYEAAKDVGIKIEYMKNYWPRILSDKEGFLMYFQGRDDWSIIEEMIKKRAEQAGREIRDMTPDEIAQDINVLMRGYQLQNLMLSRPGPAKERTVESVTAELDSFYEDSLTAVFKYIKLMTAKIGEREFFGRETKLIQALRKTQRARLTRLTKLKRRVGLKGAPEETYKEHISKTYEAWMATNERLTRLKARPLTDTIGGYIDRVRRAGLIQPAQEKQIQDILMGIFDPTGMGRITSMISSGVYIDTLNSPLQAITQLDEFAYSFYKSPWHSIPALITTIARRSEVTSRDIGIVSIGEEFQGPSMHKALSTLLKSIGFEQIDRLNKENDINTVLRKYRSQARNAELNPDFVKRMQRVFGEEYQNVIADLKKGEITDNIKYLLFNELLDIQPLAISEMPESYAKAGSWRLAYSLKSFYIRRLDYVRNECFKDMKSKDTFARGFGKLVWLTFAFALMGCGSDLLKDFIRGRKFSLSDSMTDNILRMVFFSKYQAWRTREKGFGTAILEGWRPPTKAIDALSRDIINTAMGKDRGWELWRSVPIVGEEYYWWFGQGSQKKNQRGMRKIIR
jgi:hypothetical protein